MFTLKSDNIELNFNQFKFGIYSDMSLIKMIDKPKIDTRLIIEPNNIFKTWTSGKITNVICYENIDKLIIIFEINKNKYTLYEH